MNEEISAQPQSLSLRRIAATVRSLRQFKPIAFLLLLLSAGLVFVEPCHGGSSGFEKTGNLVQARAGHTATLLQDGRVLVVGNNGSAELYDPVNGTWAATGNLVQSRSAFTATLLSNGKVLVAGGLYQSGLATAELYDPATGSWTMTGSMADPRYSHTATPLPDGKVLVAGGIPQPSAWWEFHPTNASTELYDPISGTWTRTGDLHQSRESHTATSLSNGKVLVVGGYFGGVYGTIFILSTAELYDPASGTWTSASFTPRSPRANHTATLLPDGRVLVTGGYGSPSAVVYDPVSNTWTETGSMSIARYFHAAALLPNGKVLVTGGRGSTGDNVAKASAELYNPATGTWSATGSLNDARNSHTATLLSNGYVLIAGGSNDTTLASTELYGPKPTLLNISTRVNVQTGDNAMIGGFIITGTEQKTVLVRGIGPSLDVPGALADPIIEVHGPSGEFLGANDNWRDALTRQQIIDSGLAPANDFESALWGVINPGAYTVIVRGQNDAAGVGLFEVYDLGEAADSNLANISTRGPVQTGDNVLIGGFIVGGGTEGWTARVVVRAIGPSVPISGALADPTLELRDASGTLLASNDNWKTHSDGSSQQTEIEATGLQPANDLESALLQTFPAGNYTAIVRGVNNTTGTALIEAYNLP